MTRTSLPCGRRTCRCRPRSVPPTDREWLSCTNGAVDAVLAVPLGVVGLEEEAAAVAMHVGLDDQHAGQCRWGRRARQDSCSSTRNRYWPYALDSIARASRGELAPR